MTMKKFLTCLLTNGRACSRLAKLMGASFRSYLLAATAVLGLNTACGQQNQGSQSEGKSNFENTDVQGFAELIDGGNVVVLDVRTAAEFAEGHIQGAILIDQGQSDFVERAKAALPTNNTIAIYCRSGRRSANAAERLADAGFKCINLKGGIIAWKKANMPVTTETYEVDVFQTKSGKTVKFHALMHASIRIEYDGKEIEVDPVLKLHDRTVDYGKMPKADYIFVTHEHMDHLDKEAIKVLTKEGTQLITNKNCADMLGHGIIMKNGDSREITADFTVEAVPAYNTTEANKKFHPKGRDNGFVLTIDGLRIYIAGDTEDIPEMAAIKDIDIAFMPCNQPFTMTPDQLVRAAKMVKPKVLFPYHYGETNVSGITGLMKSEGIDVRIRHYE